LADLGMLLKIEYTLILLHTPYLQREGNKGQTALLLKVVKAHIHKEISCAPMGK
jgi:hypothetical protein